MDFDVDWKKQTDFDAIREARLKRLQQEMREQGLDGILSFRAEHIRFATNMRPLWWSINFTDRNCALIPLEGEPILYVTSGDWRRCQETMYWLPKDNIRPCGTMGDYGIAKHHGQRPVRASRQRPRASPTDGSESTPSTCTSSTT